MPIGGASRVVKGTRPHAPARARTRPKGAHPMRIHLDHYVARGGLQDFSPLTSRGPRFVEPHGLADASRIRFVEEEFLERAYHGEPQGSFECNDPLLDDIWRTGIETCRACAEDALVWGWSATRPLWMSDSARQASTRVLGSAILAS
jgi:hypothetical protein